jgi:hypothetical protein
MDSVVASTLHSIPPDYRLSYLFLQPRDTAQCRMPVAALGETRFGGTGIQAVFKNLKTAIKVFFTN